MSWISELFSKEAAVAVSVNPEVGPTVEEVTAERDKVKEELYTLKDEIRDLKQEHKVAEEDIKHMLKMHEDRKDLEIAKIRQEEEAKTATEVAKVKDEYQDKQIAFLRESISSGDERFEKILERLPDVNARLKISS